VSDPAEDPWKAWAGLSSAPWKHRLDLPGGTLLAEVSGLEQLGDVWVWTEERIWSAGGACVLVRASRRSDDPQEALVVLAAASPAALARRAFAELGRTPGMIELLGRAGIELGVAPDDVIEGDEIDDWPAEPPGRRT
jgi:hypothetical protein